MPRVQRARTHTHCPATPSISPSLSHPPRAYTLVLHRARTKGRGPNPVTPQCFGRVGSQPRSAVRCLAWPCGASPQPFSTARPPPCLRRPQLPSAGGGGVAPCAAWPAACWPHSSPSRRCTPSPRHTAQVRRLRGCSYCGYLRMPRVCAPFSLPLPFRPTSYVRGPNHEHHPRRPCWLRPGGRK